MSLTSDLFLGLLATFLNLLQVIPTGEPLRKLTPKGQKWTLEGIQSLERGAVRSTSFGLFSSNAPPYLITDASPVVLSAILLQDQVSVEHKPIAYISRSLTSTERRYSQIEHGELSCVWAVERLHNYLFGIEFTFLTDKPLSSMFHPHSSKVLPPRIQPLAWRLHQYTFRIQHFAGNANTADSLPRLPSKQNDCSDNGFVWENYVRFVYMSNMSDLQVVTRSDMRFETSKDVTLSKLLAQIHNGQWSRDTDLEPYSRIKEELSIFEGVILTGNRIVVPQSLRKQILSLAHETHQGIVKTKQFLRTHFFSPGMDDATEKMIKNCQA